MSHNTFGNLLKFTTWGESHGPAIGCVVDGCPPNINIDEKDIWWSASDIGWIVGHSYIVYAPLFKGCTTVLFEGKPVGTPDAGAFWKIISDYKVKSLFTAPTAFRAIKKRRSRWKIFF